MGDLFDQQKRACEQCGRSLAGQQETMVFATVQGSLPMGVGPNGAAKRLGGGTECP